MNYPKDQELIKNAEQIYDYNFTTYMPSDVRAAMKELGALLTRCIPVFDRYRLYCESVKISEADLREMYPQWDILPTALKNKIHRATEQAERQRLRDLLGIAHLIDTQARHLNNVTDEEYEQIEAFAESI